MSIELTKYSRFYEPKSQERYRVDIDGKNVIMEKGKSSIIFTDRGKDRSVVLHLDEKGAKLLLNILMHI